MDFERLAAEHKDAVYRQLVRMCGNHEDAEDVLVTSLMKAYNALGSLDDVEAFRAWLGQIGRRTCGRLKRRESVRHLVGLDTLAEQGFELPSDDASPEILALEMETKNCVMNALEGLPDIYREIYVLRDIQGLSVAETAEKLEISEANVKTRLHRARTLLRDSIDETLNCA